MSDDFLDLKLRIVDALELAGVDYASATDYEDDVYVEGPLSVIYEVCRDWRSEVEELG